MDKLQELKNKYVILTEKEEALLSEIKDIESQITNYEYPTEGYEKVLGKLYDLSNIVPLPKGEKVFKYYCLPFELISCEEFYVNLKAKILSYKIDQKGVVMNMECNHDMSIKISGFYNEFFNDKYIVNNPEDEIKELMNQGAQQFLLNIE